MNRYTFFIASSCLTLSGCSLLSPTPPAVAIPVTREIVEKPIYVKPPITKMRYQLQAGNNPALVKAYEKYVATGKADNIVTDGFMQFAYNIGQQPVIAASPLQITEISLQPGETMTNTTSGDPQRWSYSVAYSGKAETKQAHILVKPSQPDLSTNFVITTDKRAYNLKIVSTHDGKYVKNVRFWYPDEIQAYWDKFNAEQGQQTETVATLPNLDVSHLNFDYCVTANWRSSRIKPTHIFDDGTHTYIQFPSYLNAGDMPALFIQSNSGQEIVNYRSKPPYFVVDKIFHQATLVLGVGKNSMRVTLLNRRA